MRKKTEDKKEQNTCPSLTIPEMDGSLHLVPGRYKLPTAPGGSLRKDSPGWEKAETKFTAISGLPACVCVSCVASIYARVCSSVSCVPLKPDIHTYILGSAHTMLSPQISAIYCLC